MAKNLNKPLHPALNIAGVSGCRLLRLSLTKEAFEITGTDEKPFELRNKGKWIDSRLFIMNNDLMEGWPKDYDYVLLINGYGNDRPWKLFEFQKVDFTKHPIHWSFSNGLTFYQQTGDYIIRLGKMIESGNLHCCH